MGSKCIWIRRKIWDRSAKRSIESYTGKYEVVARRLVKLVHERVKYEDAQ
jgi:hypothetical protein